VACDTFGPDTTRLDVAGPPRHRGLRQVGAGKAKDVHGLDSLVTSVSPALAYPVLFLLVGGESGGLPIPGETSIMVAAIAAAQGALHIWAVLLVAAAAAIIGDNVGYLIGRRFGRRIFLWGSWARERRCRWLEEADGFFQDWGPAAVAAGRWLPVARFTVAWLAGINHMRWRRFFLWNAVGGVSWVATIGLAAYFLGQAARSAIEALGFVGLIGLVLGVAGHLYWRHRRAASA
jgi:membrane-associated protein